MWSPGIAWLDICFVSHKIASGCWLGCIFIWRFNWGRIYSQAPSGCWQNPFPCSCMTEALRFKMTPAVPCHLASPQAAHITTVCLFKSSRRVSQFSLLAWSPIKNKNKGPGDLYLFFHIYSTYIHREEREFHWKPVADQYGFKTGQQSLHWLFTHNWIFI